MAALPPIQVDPTQPTPASRQIVEAVLEQIAAGWLRPEDRLPSVRGLAAEARVNPNTVGKAYRELDAMGAVTGRAGAGVYVTSAGPRIARADRRGATLQALQTVIESAVRVGHDPARLLERVEQWLAQSSINGTARSTRAPTDAKNGVPS